MVEATNLGSGIYTIYREEGAKGQGTIKSEGKRWARRKSK